MGNHVFEASIRGQCTNHETAEDAIKAVEDNGGGNVVKFVKRPNLPGCLPSIVLNSVGLWSYENGEWWSHYIYDGHGGKLNQERPS